jgi:hypothetical protein
MTEFIRTLMDMPIMDPLVDAGITQALKRNP